MRMKPGPKPKNGKAMSSTERRRKMIARQRAFREENDMRLTQGLPVRAAYYDLIKNYAKANGEKVDAVFAGILNKAIGEIFDKFHAEKFDKDMEAFEKGVRDGTISKENFIPMEGLMGDGATETDEVPDDQSRSEPEGGDND